MVDGGHAESLAEVIWYERRVAACFRKLTFVDRQHDQMAEIEVTCFQNAHYL